MLTNELEGVIKDVYKTDWQWEEDDYTVTRTTPLVRRLAATTPAACCTTRKDGKLEKIEGDPLDPCANGSCACAAWTGRER